jgi:hypothetical protein
MDDLTKDPEFKAWAAHVHAHVMPLIRDAETTIQLVPKGETDIKFAVELGLSIMLDKPIITIIAPGMEISDHLRRVSDQVVELDLEADDARQKVKDAVESVMGER